jgi:prefoldin subunit 5
MSNRVQACDHSNLRVNALVQQFEELTQQLEELTQQLEELQQLRDRVRSAEAKAVRAWRYKGRRQEKGYRSSQRSFWWVH